MIPFRDLCTVWKRRNTQQAVTVPCKGLAAVCTNAYQVCVEQQMDYRLGTINPYFRSFETGLGESGFYADAPLTLS
jgi:hypothetical protein